MILELIALGIASMYFWEHIVDFFSKRIIPWVRKNVSNTAGDFLAKLISFLDGKIVPLKSLIKKGWEYFKTHFISGKTTYTKVDANNAVRTTETIIRDSENEFNRTVVEEKISWSDLPKEIREKMINENSTEGVVDEKEYITQKMEERCEEEGIQITI